MLAVTLALLQHSQQSDKLHGRSAGKLASHSKWKGHYSKPGILVLSPLFFNLRNAAVPQLKLTESKHLGQEIEIQ